MVLESNELNFLVLQDGENGIPGTSPDPNYTWVKYSQYSDGTELTDDSANAKYIGIAYNKTTKNESENKEDYNWTLIKGSDGKDAYTVILDNENISFSTDNNRKPLSDQSFSSKIIVMKGINPISDYTIGTITSVQGVEISIENNIIILSVSTSTLLSYDYGSIEIPIIIDGNTFTKIITYSVSKAGTDGKEGISVTSVDVMYYQSSSSTELKDGSWSTDSPTWKNGKYIWSKTVTSYSSGNSTETIPVCITGEKGNSGTSVAISSTSIKYQSGTSGTEKPTGTWLTNIPNVEEGQYLWSITTVTYSDGSKTETYSVSKVGKDGVNGTNGTNITIKSTSVTYQTSSNGTVSPTGTWLETIPNVANGQYLWSKTTVIYSDNTQTDAYSVSRNGINGTNGTGIKSSYVTYQSGTSGTTAPTGNWLSTVPSINEGNFLWTKTVIEYTDNTESVSYSVSKIGAKGSAGKGISSTSITYQKSTSGTVTPTGTWLTSIPSVSANEYLWTRTIINYTEGNPSTSYSVGMMGAKGDKGDTGTGIVSITEEYYLSTSKETQTGSSWKATPDPWENGKYMWTRSKIVYENPSSTKYTEPICDSSWEAANDVQNNLDKEVKTITETISGVSSKVDDNTKSITDKVWQTDITTSINNYDENKIQEIRDRVTETETDIFGIKTTISDVETTLETKADGETVEKIEERVTNVEQTASGIKTEVSNVQKELDNLEVGGRNLIIQSKTSIGWVNNAGNITIGSGYRASDYIAVKPGDIVIFQLWATSSKQLWVDDTYFDTNQTFIPSYGNDYETTDYILRKYTVPANAYYMRMSYSWADGYKVKLEKGTLPTDWTPAPEDTAEEISSVRTIAEQTAEGFSWIVESGDSSTNFTLTDRTSTLVANYINLNGLVTFNGLDDDTSEKIDTASSNASTALINAAKAQTTADNAQSYAEGVNTTANDAKTKAESANTVIANWCYNNDVTYINGGDIYTGTITSKQLNTDAIKSNNYSYSSGKYSTAGTFLDLSNGAFTSKNFAIDSSGNAYFNGNGSFNGTITATAGEIGGCTIENGKLIVPIANISGSLSIGDITDLETQLSNLSENIEQAETNATNAAKSYTDGQITTVNETIGNVDDKADNAQSTADTANSKATNHYGTCTTASGTVSKVVTCSGFTLYKGATIWVKFTNANSVAKPTLNVNSTGAKSIYAYGSTLTATSAYNWVAGSTVLFVYNGTQWELTDSAGLSKANSAYSLANTANTKIGSWCATNDVTYIDGGKIYTGSVTADQIAANTITTNKIKANAITTSLLATDALKSTGYTNVDSDTRYSEVGTFFDLANGSITSKNFAIDSSGNAYFRGDVEATTLSALDEYRIYYTYSTILGDTNVISDFSNPILKARYDETSFAHTIYTSLDIGDNLDSTDNAYISIVTYKSTINSESNSGDIDVSGINSTDIYLLADYVKASNQFSCTQFESTEFIQTALILSDSAELTSITAGSIIADSIVSENLSSTNAEFSEVVKCNKGISTIGNNTYSSSEDYISYWNSYNNSVHYYNDTGTLLSKPSTYGFLLNYANTNNVHQIWLGQPDGRMYHRSGNADGWSGNAGDGSWKTILDSSNYASYRHDRLISGNYGARLYISSNIPVFIPTNSSGTYSDGTSCLGHASGRWKSIYASSSSIITTSDRNEKHSIEDISEQYEEFFMKLRGVTYMWNKKSEDDTQIHDRVHCGLIAQEVNEAAESVGLSSLTAAVICRDDLNEPTYDGRTERWGLAYSELHGLEIHMIQKTIKHQEKQDEEIALLKAQIIELSERLNKLEAKG